MTMKNDVVARRILAGGIAVAMVLAGAALFMFSISPATASESPNFEGINFGSPAGDAGGTIMMDYTAVHVPSQDKTYYECMVWNTVTGESKLYFYSYDSKKFKAYEDNVQLPSRPLN